MENMKRIYVLNGETVTPQGQTSKTQQVQVNK